MKLVLKKQVGGVMEQQQQLPPELMQLLMSLPKDIQQYVLSLPIEQQVQELIDAESVKGFTAKS